MFGGGWSVEGRVRFIRFCEVYEFLFCEFFGHVPHQLDLIRMELATKFLVMGLYHIHGRRSADTQNSVRIPDLVFKFCGRDTVCHEPHDGPSYSQENVFPNHGRFVELLTLSCGQEDLFMGTCRA